MIEIVNDMRVRSHVTGEFGTCVATCARPEFVRVKYDNEKHEVSGGNEEEFPAGLWATSVEADSTDEAEAAAVAEMRGEV